jgi:hypothetical protein
MNALAPQDAHSLWIHSYHFRGRARPLVPTTQLTSDEVREEVSEDPEKCQPRDTVGGENPDSAAC